jgi:predicted PurR-regulated permease PerM
MNFYNRQALSWGAVALTVGVLLWILRPVLAPFLLGGLIAYVLQPGVEWLVRHRTPRGLAALAMMLMFGLVAALLVLLVFAVIQKEGPELIGQLPSLVVRLNTWLQPKLAFLGLSYSLDLGNVRDMVAVNLKASEQTVSLAVWNYLRASGNVMISVVGNVVLVPLVLFYLLYDRHEAFARLESFVPRRWLGKTREFITDIDQMLSQYLRGQLLVMGVLAAFYPIALTIAGFEIALPVGLLTGLAVFIPYIGFATGLVFALLATLLQFGSWRGDRGVHRRPDSRKFHSHAAPRWRTHRAASARGDFSLAGVRPALRILWRATRAAGQRDPGDGSARTAPPLSRECALR